MIDVIAEAEGISLSSMQFKAMVGKGNNHTKVFFFTWSIICVEVCNVNLDRILSRAKLCSNSFLTSFRN